MKIQSNFVISRKILQTVVDFSQIDDTIILKYSEFR